MIFPRTKQIVFTNNKGGVGKTTLAFNIGKKLADQGYKTVLIDLDPQCNLSRLALGEEFIERDIDSKSNIFGVIEGLISGTADINKNIIFTPLSENLSLLEGSLKLSGFETMIASGFNEASSGLARGYNITSAIDRFLKEKGLYEEIDIFIIDTNPSLSQLNKAIFLGTDYFVVPMMPDAFNHQGIENIGNFFEQERRNWNMTAKILSRTQNISAGSVLLGEPIFLGYIINSYNVYSKKPIYSQKLWIEKLPNQIKKNLSLKHCKNGLVELSYAEAIGRVQDYGQLSTLSQDKHKAIFDITEQEARAYGTQENLKKSQEEFETITANLIERLKKW
ncbi:hypothetical protein AUK10_04510 [Candidatus Gracilibacteria bacterium CG2_30_37_12]|nr:MAG: hypothetical protein AUK10_04510 [Candidatus Gracilibacteria bacterium CG2_30_37_12]